MRVTAAVAAIRARSPLVPAVAVIAGSGLSGLAERVTDPVSIAYADIADWPASTVPGHAGELVLGLLAGRPAVVARGRAHHYEGYSWEQVVFNVRVFAALGATAVVVTNAAGGLNPAYRPGDLMFLSDHIFLPGMAGGNPLVGPNDAALGPRFPGMVHAYDPVWRARAMERAAALGLTAHAGVYAMVGGPSFETPAEARFLVRLGADAVGMSTAPEAVVARHMGLKVLGISLITNLVPTEPPPVEDHDLDADLHAEVMATGAAAAVGFSQLIEQVVGDA